MLVQRLARHSRVLSRRGLWLEAWSGDKAKFNEQFVNAAPEERRNLITEIDPNSGWTALHFATVYGQEGMVKDMLLECPDLIDLPNRQGWKPLHFAAGFGQIPIIDLLISLGADLACRNETSPECKGWTPLHRAIRWWLDPGKPNAVSHLLSIGADATLVDDVGRTPVDLAADSCCFTLAEYLHTAAVSGNETAEFRHQSEATRSRLRHAVTEKLGDNIANDWGI